MEEALTKHLLASTAVTAMVGDRITWDERPQGDSLPSLVLQVIDGAPEYSDEGSARLTTLRVQIDCWATHADGANGGTIAKQLGRAVAEALPVAMMIDGIDFQGVFPEIIHDFAPEIGPGQVKFFRRSLDYMISYTG
jgi:hypothetical protein